MERLELAFGDAIALTWHDSQAGNGWQYDISRPREIGLIQTLGRVVQNSDRALTITTSIREGRSPATMDDLSIPWTAVEEIQVLEDYSL